MTKLPQELDTPENLLIGIKEMRDRALGLGTMDIVVLLSHTHAYIHWMKENWEELKNG
mgnify:CR=1 FL=1